MTARPNYANDPAAFVLDLQIPTRDGARRWADVATPFQRDWLQAMAPSFLAVAKGEPPPTPKFWIEASKGCSKTTLVAALLLWLLIYRRRPGNGVAGAVDRDNAAEVLLAAKELLAENPRLGESIEIQAWQIVGKLTDCVIEVVATDRKGSQGGRPLVTYVDECGHIPDGDFEFVQNVLDDAAKTGGLTIVTSNAGWLGTKAYELRELARTSPLWAFLRWDQPSPLTPKAELDEAKLRNSPSRYNRLYFTIWGPRDEGDALDPGHIAASITRDGPSRELPTGFGFAVVGADFGFKRDRTGVCTVALELATCKVHVLDLHSWKAPVGGEVSVDDVERYVSAVARRYRAIRICPDVYGLQGSIQRWRMQGLPVQPIAPTPANQDLQSVSIVSGFRDRQFALFPDAELLQDLAKFSIVERTSAGIGQSYKMVAPRDSSGHADLGTAFVLAATQCLQYAANVQRMRADEAREAEELRQQNGGHDPLWGRDAREIDSPFDPHVEFRRRR